MGVVPEAYRGVWQRKLITTTSGFRDSTTQVFWTQTEKLFVDCRVPQPAPASHCKSLEDCSSADLAALAAQQGFAGNTVVSGDHCQWNRELDYQPAGGPPDIGNMTFKGSEQVIEDGLDGSYQEIWERLPASHGQSLAVRLTAKDDARRPGLLVASGDYFHFAADRTVALEPSGRPMSEVISTLELQQQRAILAFELSFGRINAGQQPWEITCSSLPGRVGQCLLPAEYTLSQLTDDAGVGKSQTMGVYAPADGWHLSLA